METTAFTFKTDLESAFIDTNGIRLHAMLAGPADGTPLILLHGFPEYWFGWRHQIDALAAAGFRLIIPDQRGYNLSDKPSDAAEYNLDVVAKDLLGLIDHLGLEKARVVGHDWGGAALWWTANRYPERLERIAILNVPHHVAFRQALRDDPKQRRRVAYMGFFQLPVLPEWLLRFRGGGYVAIKAFGDDHVHFPPDVVAAYQQAWAQPGARRGMLNWYRALRKAPPERLESPRISVPTLLIWGKRDQVFKPAVAEASIALCDDGHLHLIENATHWVQHEAADEVNQQLIDWLKP